MPRNKSGKKTDHTYWTQREEELLAECFIEISKDPKTRNDQSNEMFWYKILANSTSELRKLVVSENEENLFTRVLILFKDQTGREFTHKSAWIFLKDKYKWKNPESMQARRTRGRVTEEEPECFRDDDIPRASREDSHRGLHPRISPSNKVQPVTFVVRTNNSNNNLNRKDGLCHVFELAEDHADNIEGKYKIWESVKAKNLNVSETFYHHFSTTLLQNLLAYREDQNPEEFQEPLISFKNRKHPVLAEVESRASVLPLEVPPDETKDSPMDDRRSKKKDMEE
nr:hypothetical protein [Tanacetum cinerariifolium]